MDDAPLAPGQYVIPRRIPRGYQLTPGVSLKEVGIAAAGLGAGGLVWWGLHLVGLPLVYRGFLAIIPLFLGVGMALPLDDTHVWEWLRDFWAFRHKPKTLLYNWTANDW